jgi:hypothetical protein
LKATILPFLFKKNLRAFMYAPFVFSSFSY